MKHDNHLRYALNIIDSFHGEMPLSTWLKDFFRKNPQMGSKDRRQVSEMVYCFYRLAWAGTALPANERIFAGLFLCTDSPNELLAYFKPAWNDQITLDAKYKIELMKSSGIELDINEIFPWKDKLSPGINHGRFCASFIQQPDLFVRIRPGYENIVRQKLNRSGIVFREIMPTSLAFVNSTKLDSIIDLNKEAVIQDLNSQRIGEIVWPMMKNRKAPINVWDCCAGSGGKSIMLYDLSAAINLTVSDMRETILLNLKKRFNEAGIVQYKSFISDLTKSSAIPIDQLPSFDIVVADVPCSGSGTWSRTPESLCFFNEKEIERYADIQRKIVFNILPRLKKGAIFIYITCSVFKEENEDIVDAIRRQFQIQPGEMKLFSGYDQKADSMFAASFIV